jgi:ABC-type nickel/cobalt efflux system permease component RcnA
VRLTSSSLVRLLAAVAGVAIVISAAFGGIPVLRDVWGALLLDVQIMQRSLHNALAEAIRLVETQGAAAGWALAGLSFLYGVFHAIGPGHGKFVIATYLATHEDKIRRGVGLSILSSLMQGLTAIVLVEAAVSLLQLRVSSVQSATPHLETASYALIALVGAVLTFGAVRRFRRRWRAMRHGEAAHRHEDGCGHVHGPKPSQIAGPLAPLQALGIVVSVGIRPCTGAILVLILAHLAGLHWAGVAAVAAMSIGTALAIAVLAAATVLARRTMMRVANRQDAPRPGFAFALDGIAAIGGMIFVTVGCLLVHASLTAPRHPLL